MKAEYVDHMGTDRTVVNAARVSFSKHKEFFEEEDIKLINYLARHGHWTPFGHPQIQLRMTAPVFVRTQCFKHKVGFTENEVSRRYVSGPPTFYEPESWRGAPTGGAKQGSGGDLEGQASYTQYLKHVYYEALSCYEYMIEEGVAPEQARMVLPQSMNTEWYWTGSLAAYARFFHLRSDPHAQKEIQYLAEMVGQIIEPLFPYSWVALTGGEEEVTAA